MLSPLVLVKSPSRFIAVFASLAKVFTCPTIALFLVVATCVSIVDTEPQLVSV